MRVTLSHTFPCTPEAFWKGIFFDPAYNEALYLRDLGFSEWRVLSSRDTGDGFERVVRAAPPQRVPEAIRKLVRGAVSYEERGTFTASAGIYRFKTIPSALSDKVLVGGTVRAEPAGDGRMVKKVEIDVEARVMLVGGMIERFITDEARESYAKIAAFTVRWIEEKRF